MGLIPSPRHDKAWLCTTIRRPIPSEFNLLPKSLSVVLGVIIRSPEISEWFASGVDENLPSGTYEVFLNDKGKIRWRDYDNGEEVILDKEPQTTWSQRFSAGFMRILPIRGQL